MEILVCVKQVPDTEEVKIDPVTHTVIRAGVPNILNPFDKNALEEALRIKDEKGAKVTLVSMGPPQATAVLKKGLSMGADDAYLLTDRKVGGSDTLATGYCLAQTIKKIAELKGIKQFDMIMCGKQAIDGDTAQVGPQIAAALKIAQLTYVAELKVEDDKVIAKQENEEGYLVTEAAYPVLITAVKELNEPRFSNIKDIRRSVSYDITFLSADDIKVDEARIGLAGSPTTVRKTFTPPQKSQGIIYDYDDVNSSVTSLVDKLVEQNIL